MPNYVLIGKDLTGQPLVSVSLASIDQEAVVIQEIDIVNAVRTALAGADGVISVQALMHKQVITEV
jgi:hypothetical protein